MEAGGDLAEQRLHIWQALTRATVDRHHPWRTPALATVDAAGLPNARTVVLRRASAKEQRLDVFTDARSRKVSELRQTATAALVFWHPGHRWQLRVQTQVLVLTDGAAVDAAWDQVKSSAGAADYLSVVPPGSTLPTSDSHPDVHAVGRVELNTTEGQHHFALLQMRVVTLDWLHLSREGHERAVWIGDSPGQWVQA